MQQSEPKEVRITFQLPVKILVEVLIVFDQKTQHGQYDKEVVVIGWDLRVIGQISPTNFFCLN